MIDHPHDVAGSVASADCRDWDALVIGAGPAGTTIARILAGRGYRILLTDKRPFPRDKVCGDGLIPDALNALRRAGLHDAVQERGFATNVLSVFSASRVRVDLHGQFLTLRRRELDQLMLEAALECGAAFRVSNVDHLEDDGREIRATLSTQATPIRARLAILATGSDVSLLARQGVSVQMRPSAVALRCYVRSPFTIDQLVMSFDRSIAPGYAWIFPLGNDAYNIGCGVFNRDTHGRPVNLRHTFETFVSRFPLARELWRARIDATPLRGARLRCGLDTSAAFNGRRTIAIGETIAATFPFTGEGIGKAMETGEAGAPYVAAALAHDDCQRLAAFPAHLESTLRPRYKGYRIAENWLAHAWLGDFVARRLRHSRTLRRKAAGVVSETTDPQSIFSWRVFLPERLT
ncbi:MAG: FAD-dependent monooxygenase [Gemmatimonadota bacterium]|nr:FAD-dependent monooxygenase [Gemmatimonadota bacterium]